MTDILARIRWLGEDVFEGTLHAVDLIAAADEIERLRADAALGHIVRQWANSPDMGCADDSLAVGWYACIQDLMRRWRA